MPSKTNTEPAANKSKHTVYTDEYPELEQMIRKASRSGVCFSRFAATALERAYSEAGWVVRRAGVRTRTRQRQSNFKRSQPKTKVKT